MLEQQEAALEAIVARLRGQAQAQAEQIAATREHYEVLATQWHVWRQYALKTKLFGRPNACPKPPREIPPEQLDAFTMGGVAAVEDAFYDATYPDNWPLIYTDMEI